MINVYKLGREFYKDGIDKNGGLHEAELITDACRYIANVCRYIDTSKKLLIIINGIATQDDREHLDFLFDEMDLRIFIATDPCFKDNIDIVNQCDYLLHQAGNAKVFIEYCRDTLGVKSTMRYQYSYVPELFYKPVYQTTIKEYSAIFGGGHIDEKVLAQYADKYPLTLYTRNSKGDNRIPYKEFMSKLQDHMFALIISRDEYLPFAWVTPRYYEALSFATIPILDSHYDEADMLNAKCVKLNSINDFYDYCHLLAAHKELRWVILDNLTEIAEGKRYAFNELMTTIIGAL